MIDSLTNQITPGVLVVADISGYTRFSRLHYTSLLHAEQIISELMDSIIETAAFPLQVGQLEGDAVLMYVETLPENESAVVRDVLAQVERFFEAFNILERSLIACDAGCVCQACSEIGELRLKAVVHFGVFSRRSFQGVTELVGSDVTLLRALLKSPMPEREHILLTEQIFALSGDFEGDSSHEVREFLLGEIFVSVHVYLPQIDINSMAAPKGAGPALSKRLNQHSFGRMLLSKPRAKYANLPNGKMNLPLYLLEGISSGINILRKMFRRKSLQMLIVPVMLILVEVRSASETNPVEVDRILKDCLNMARPPLILNKLEGNAAFLYAFAENDNDILTENLVRQAERMYSRLSVHEAAHRFHFRVICHFGDVVIKRMGQFDELAGLPVILIHRILQTTIPSSSSIWMTAPFFRFAGHLKVDGDSVIALDGLDDESVKIISLS